MENFNTPERDYPVTRNNASWEHVSACIFFYDYRAKKKTGLYPVKIRLTYKHERTYYDTGYSLSIEDWKKFDEGRKDVKKCRDAIHVQMKRMETETLKLFKGGEFSFQLLASRMGRRGGDNVIAAFEDRIEKLKSSGRFGNAAIYETALSSIKAHTGKETLPFHKITPVWLEKYDAAMEEAGKSHTTRSMYLRALRAIILASDSPSPFGKGKFMIKAGKGRKIALTKQQMNELMTLPVKPGSSTDKMRDLFYFSYLGNGINVRDLVKLRWDDLNNDTIVYERAKTARTNSEERLIVMPVDPRMKHIIEKWGKRESKYIFGFLSDKPSDEEIFITTKNVTKQINKHLKKLTKGTALPKCTTYTARHSFASVHMRNQTNINMISKLMGHSRITTTQSYLADFNVDEVRAANEAL